MSEYNGLIKVQETKVTKEEVASYANSVKTDRKISSSPDVIKEEHNDKHKAFQTRNLLHLLIIV